MINLSQYDMKWADVTIGNTASRLGRWGCTITCVSMASDYFNCFKTPKELAKQLSFTAGALLIWQSIEKVLCCKFLKRFYGWDNQVISEALKDPRKVALIEVNHSHWVLAVGRDWFRRGHYMVYDPLGAKRVSTAKYGQITGGAILIKK